MKLSDIPPHITDLNPPWFHHAVKHSDSVDVKPLFHLCYYDGPLSCIFRCLDKVYYAKAVYAEDRKYWVAWELSSEQSTTILDNHALFQEHVGTHTDYFIDDEGEVGRQVGAARPQAEWNKFYKAERKQVDFGELEKEPFLGVLLNPFRSW